MLPKHLLSSLDLVGKYLIYGKSTHNFNGHHSITVDGFCYFLCHSMEVV